LRGEDYRAIYEIDRAQRKITVLYTGHRMHMTISLDSHNDCRCGLEYQRNDDYQLTDYVQNARNKLKSAAPSFQPKSERIPLKEDFDRLLVESVREAIEDALGKDSAESAFRMLERDVTFDKLPQRLSTFYITLNKMFGRDHGTIETAIARKLYLKLSLEFIETPNTALSRYVELALIKLSEREQQGFHISG